MFPAACPVLSVFVLHVVCCVVCVVCSCDGSFTGCGLWCVVRGLWISDVCCVLCAARCVVRDVCVVMCALLCVYVTCLMCCVFRAV